MDSISPVYARLVLLEIEAQGLDPAPLFEGLSLTREELVRGGDLAVEDFLQILRRGQRLCGNDRLGLILGSRANVLALGPVGPAMAVAPTVREALQVLQSFTGLHASHAQATATSLMHGLRVSIAYTRDPGDLRRLHSETALLVLQRYVETVCAAPLQGAVFRFDFPRPHYADDYRQCLGGEFGFDASEASILVPRPYLDRPSPFYNAQLWQAALDRLSKRLKALSSGAAMPFTEYVRARLGSSEPPLPDLAAMAAGLHASERTLNRHLQAEGSSFRALKSEALSAWARAYLAQTGQSVESIAAALGYHDTANFRRAFRRNEGCSPSEYRKQSEID